MVVPNSVSRQCHPKVRIQTGTRHSYCRVTKATIRHHCIHSIQGAWGRPGYGQTGRAKYLSMMVGVDALIASWCKIFRPESHLTASSLESAGEGVGREALFTLGRSLLASGCYGLNSQAETLTTVAQFLELEFQMRSWGGAPPSD